MTQRLNLVLPDNLYEAMKRVSKKTGVPLSVLVRKGVALLLTEQGEEVGDWEMEWGGVRPKAEEKP